MRGDEENDGFVVMMMLMDGCSDLYRCYSTFALEG
jgi:hypothetical protein